MAGSICLSLTQQFDNDSKEPLSGGLLYSIQAGTTSTPQNAYQDSGLSIAYSNPIELDESGRVPQLFFADGNIKIRLTNSAGVQQFVQDNILVIGPSSGGGGGGTVDPTTIFQTGDVMWLDVDGTRTGWVRDNGRTIGSAASGATERANADTQALFEFLWNTYSNTFCAVSGGRGASANADWVANKTIATPDKRGYLHGGLDTMGASSAGRLANAPVYSGSTSLPGSLVGDAVSQLALTNLPAQPAPTGTVSVGAPSLNIGSNTYFGNVGTDGTSKAALLANSSGASGGANPFSITNITANAPSASFTGNAPTGQNATQFNNVPYTILGTFYRKL